MAKLRAVKPEIVETPKPKFMISGKSGIGKTWFSLDFPGVYYVDCEGGAVRKEYREKLSKSGGVYFGKEQGSQDFPTVIAEIEALATNEHTYKTLVIDSFTKLYNIASADAEREHGSDFGKDKKEANKPTRQLMRWLDKLDMTVILICHAKDKWERKKNEQGKFELIPAGTTFEGYDKLEFELDLWVEVGKDDNPTFKATKGRFFIVKKSRVASFPEESTWPLSYAEFAKQYGQESIDRVSKKVELADATLIKEATHLLTILKLKEGTTEAWLKKAGAESFEEVDKGKLETFVKWMKDQINVPKEAANAA